MKFSNVFYNNWLFFYNFVQQGTNLIKMMSNQLTLDNFNMLSVIGKGSYAKVVLVKRKGDNNDKVYAMKILKKKYI